MGVNVNLADDVQSASTLAGLRRWSSKSTSLPAVAGIRHLHVYDFDNTLFKSPLPNAQLWNHLTASRLQNQDVFINGGWWHDQRILSATGLGIEEEEARGWDGWWNETIVSLVGLSTQESDTVSVLLTGRSEPIFSTLILRMLASKGLNFDLVCLKPEVGPSKQRFGSTLLFKQAFLQDLVQTYTSATHIRIYEDRSKQVKGFRDFFERANKTAFPEAGRATIIAEVVHVADQVTSLDPVTETAEVQRMINDHNEQITDKAGRLCMKKTVYFTGYMVSPIDTARLLSLVKAPPNMATSEIRYLANSILIAPKVASPDLLEKVGGVGHKQSWQVTGLSFYQSNIWAVRVNPVPATSQIHTHNNNAHIVLAIYKNTKPDLANNIHTWQPVPADKQFTLETIVGEKVQLKIEMESFHNDTEYSTAKRQRRLRANHSDSNLSSKREEPSRAMSGSNQIHNHSSVRGKASTHHGSARQAGSQSYGRTTRGNNTFASGGTRGAKVKSARVAYRSLDDVNQAHDTYMPDATQARSAHHPLNMTTTGQPTTGFPLNYGH